MNAIAPIIEATVTEPSPAALAELIAKAMWLRDTAVRLQATPFFDDCNLHRQRELRQLHRDIRAIERAIAEVRHA